MIQGGTVEVIRGLELYQEAQRSSYDLQTQSGLVQGIKVLGLTVRT